MSDDIWFILLCAVFLFTGAACIWLGWEISQKRRMDLIIHWHCDQVSDENRNAYCMHAGAGMLIMGAGLIVSGIGAVLFRSRVYIFKRIQALLRIRRQKN